MFGVIAGDFSFARSLVVHRRCRNVLATCYDDKDELNRKYPRADRNVQDILDFRERKIERRKKKREGVDDNDDNNDNDNANKENDKQHFTPHHAPGVLFSVDARKLGGKAIRHGFSSSSTSKEKRRQQQHNPPNDDGGPWDIICFNFPHVGGLSTDVNRQVRANQELLVSFFKGCVSLLSTNSCTDEDGGEKDFNDVDDDGEGWEWPSSDDDDDSESGETSNDGGVETSGKRLPRTGGGQIVVTLFEGEPYTLWNVRDLARHVGLRVVTSFRFPWGCYPGYSHARTIGEIEGKNGGRGGWRGEDREARMFVFEVDNGQKADLGRKKRKKGGDSDSDSD